MKKYKTGRIAYGVDAKITEVEVERESESSVWINGRRLGKKTDWYAYHDTWKDAHDHLLYWAEQHVSSDRRNLEIANSRLGNVKGMVNCS